LFDLPITSHTKRVALAAVVCAAASACARVPVGPYHLNFSASGRAPVFIEASREIVVPLTVSNTGDRPWDPSHVHLSYHWLWLVPRELASRSRLLPYQEGIRTDLERPVPAGGRASVSARLLAPSLPGAYWLQWDMVEEGVAWFAQVAPRQPRQLVIIVPAPATVLAPVPLLIAAAGLVLLGRIRRGCPVAPRWTRFAATADAWWCAAALLAKPLLLVRAVLIEPTPVAYWLTVAAAAAPSLAGVALIGRRVRPWLLWIAGTFAAVLLLGDVVYYRFFGDILSAPALLGARQTRQVWQSIRSLFTPDLLWFVVDVPAAFWLAARLSRAPLGDAARRRPRAAAGALAAIAIAGVWLDAPHTIRATAFDQMFRDRAVAEQLGPFGYHVHDLWNYGRTTLFRPAVSDAQLAEVADWFQARGPLRGGSGPLFGAAKGRNLIVVQVESLQDFVVDYVVDGQEVMPHLRRWGGDAIRFTNVTDQTNQGRTSDAEFAALTSLLPLDRGAVAFQYSSNHYAALPAILAENGYATLSAVPFEAGFWNRAVMHPSYGFQKSLFEPDFTLTEQIGWGLNDRDFLQQMVPHLMRLPRPFAAWLITMSLHHPFDDFPARHKELRLGALDSTSFGNYLHAMRFFDAALDAFIQSLKQAGLLDDSVLMVFGDHDAGFPHDEATARLIGIAPGDAAWARADRIPWFVRIPHLAADGGRLRVEPVAAGQTDFAPTLLGLLGVDAAPLPYMGRNLLGAPDDPPVLRPYGDWIDRAHLFIGHQTAGHSCYDAAGTAAVGEHACDAHAALARRTRAIANTVIAGDLQQRLRTRLAVP
jgi:phosphoglycerol transferase MdoB-like AlkP superfamily enzyme